MALVTCLTATFVFSILISTTPTISATPPYTPHAPISIDGNAQFDVAHGVNGGGSGTFVDPYIIENYSIDASLSMGYAGLEIWNTTDYFVIRNCLIENGLDGGPINGIYFYNVVNGRVDNNTCSNNWEGIAVSASSYDNIVGNRCLNNTEPIDLSTSSHCYVANNICGPRVLGSSSYGIGVFASDYNTLNNNVCENFIEAGTGYGGISLAVGSDNNIITNNTCNNNYFGIYIGDSENNIVVSNYVFSSVHRDAYANYSNFWDNNGAGNYWENWQPPAHPDANNDGVVDTTYAIVGGINTDHYPLVIGWSPNWTQTIWGSSGRTYPELQVGTWDITYDNYYNGENENNADNELKLAFFDYENGMRVTGDGAAIYSMYNSAYKTSIRFTAQAGDNLTIDNIRIWLNNEMGTSPAYNYGIQADNGSGYPSGTYLDNKLYTATTTGWQSIDLPNNIALTAGTIYHIVVQYGGSGTIDVSNCINLRGMNMLTGVIPIDGRVDNNMNTLYYTTSWILRNYDPIFVLDYANGTYRGQPYEGSDQSTLRGSTMEGERFTIYENKLLDNIGVWVSRSSTPQDNLYIVLYDITTSENKVVITVENTSVLTTFSWISRTVSPAVQLVAGHEYRLYMSSPETTPPGRYYGDDEPFCDDSVFYRSLTYGGASAAYLEYTEDGVTWDGYNYYDWAFYMHLKNYYNDAYTESSIYDATSVANWENVYWNANLPDGTSINVSVRSGNNTNPYTDGWSSWYVFCLADNNTENTEIPNSRYVQYRIDLSTNDNTVTPTLYDITIRYTLIPSPPTLVSPVMWAILSDNTPTFIWICGGYSSFSWLQVATDNAFASLVIDENIATPTTTYTPTSELPYNDYYWRVIGTNAGGQMASDNWRFVVWPTKGKMALFNDNGDVLSYALIFGTLSGVMGGLVWFGRGK